MLGSLKAACSLEEISSTLSVEVTVVVTMCAQEMKIRGAPTDWSEYFRRRNIFHVKCYNFTKDDAVRMLLEKRPSLRPWHNRPYVLEALYKLETLRAEWHAEFVAPNS
eukprot:Skav218907  [mRNA]  locus=scaffold328:440051:440561:- [translate_table: standard]